MSSSPVIAPLESVLTMSPELVERVIAILNDYLESLQTEQDGLEISSAETHDEMAADDLHWDELDAQIEEVKDVLEKLGRPVNGGETDDE